MILLQSKADKDTNAMLKDMNSRQSPHFIFQLWVLLTRCLIKFGRNFMPMRVIDVILQLVIGCVVGGIHGEEGGGAVNVCMCVCVCSEGGKPSLTFLCNFGATSWPLQAFEKAQMAYNQV